MIKLTKLSTGEYEYRDDQHIYHIRQNPNVPSGYWGRWVLRTGNKAEYYETLREVKNRIAQLTQKE